MRRGHLSAMTSLRACVGLRRTCKERHLACGEHEPGGRKDSGEIDSRKQSGSPSQTRVLDHGCGVGCSGGVDKGRVKRGNGRSEGVLEGIGKQRNSETRRGRDYDSVRRVGRRSAGMREAAETDNTTHTEGLGGSGSTFGVGGERKRVVVSAEERGSGGRGGSQENGPKIRIFCMR